LTAKNSASNSKIPDNQVKTEFPPDTPHYYKNAGALELSRKNIKICCSDFIHDNFMQPVDRLTVLVRLNVPLIHKWTDVQFSYDNL